MASTGRIARSLYRRVADAAERHEKRRAPLIFTRGPGTRPTVYFLTPDHPTASGGIRVIYRHVDILNENGIEACVLHRRPGFRCSWFANETRVAHVGEVRIGQGDLLVVPELCVDELARVPSGIRYAIFNQNSHLTWRLGGDDVARFYAAHPDFAGVICVSHHNREMLRRAFPDAPVRRVHLGIDPVVFGPGEAVRPRRIAYMPRRGQDDARQVLQILRAQGLLDDWDIVALDGLSHEAVADALRQTRIFLAFTRQEGFGLPAVEAMACGNYVIGNHGFGGREFFRPDFCAGVAPGDILGFVAAVETAVVAEKIDPDWCGSRGRRASQFVLREYSPDRESIDVTALYAELLSHRFPSLVVAR